MFLFSCTACFVCPSLHSGTGAWGKSFWIQQISDNVDMELEERCFSLVLLPALLPDVLIYTLVRLKAGKQSRPFAYQVFYSFHKVCGKKGKTSSWCLKAAFVEKRLWYPNFYFKWGWVVCAFWEGRHSSLMGGIMICMPDWIWLKVCFSTSK